VCKAARLLYIALVFSGALVRAFYLLHVTLARADARSGEGLVGTSSYQCNGGMELKVGFEYCEWF
jgi:hypothetical protein